MRQPRLIESENDLQAGVRALRRKCAVMRLVHDTTGLPPLRRRPPGLASLMRIVVGQQVSTASAAAIWTRTEAAVSPFTADAILACSDDRLRGAGLSNGKIRTMRAVATAIADGRLDLEALTGQSDASVAAGLTGISGIGPWTSDVYILICLGRADAFAAGDLALQIALQAAAGLGQRPTPQQLETFAERWQPWRGVAARLLWAYYAATRNSRSGQPA